MRFFRKKAPVTSEFEAVFDGEQQDIQEIAGLASASSVCLRNLSQDQFDEVCRTLHPQKLRVYHLKAKDLGALEQQVQLETLSLEWNTKATSLWDLSKNTALKSLELTDFSKLSDLSAVAFATGLDDLHISGGFTSKIKIDTLQPLSALRNLTTLYLGNMQVATKSLAPLAKLTNLLKIDISNQFSTEEFAHLSVALPNTESRMFSPYFKVNFGGKNMVMITGKGTKVLDAKKDAAQLAQYVLEYKTLQVDEILYHQWDPLGVCGDEVEYDCRDEYTMYAKQIAQALLDGETRDQIAQRLFQINTVQMGNDRCSIVACEEIADSICLHRAI